MTGRKAPHRMAIAASTRPTSFNDKVVELITRVPSGALKPDPRNLDPLVPMLPK